MSKKRDCVHMHRVKLKINDLDKSLSFFVLAKCKVQSLATDILSKERLQLQLVLFMRLCKKNVDIKENVSADKTHYGSRILFEVASSKKNVDIKENVSAD